MMADAEFIVVLVTTGSAEESARIARTLVGEGLAACVNQVGPIRSTYTWQGAVEDAEEYLLVVKSQRRQFAAVEARVRALHSYELPEVIALPLATGSVPYLEWLAAGSAGKAVGS
jgi:periplasmic divalent cation tolerance protein